LEGFVSGTEDADADDPSVLESPHGGDNAFDRRSAGSSARIPPSDGYNGFASIEHLKQIKPYVVERVAPGG